MNVIIDFNGYFSRSSFDVKEYCLYTIIVGIVAANNCEIQYPSSLWEDLEDDIKKNYDNYYQRYGIQWEAGSNDAKSVREHIKTQMAIADCTFLRDENQKILLLNYLSEHSSRYKLICLDDLGYSVKLRTSTECHNHDNRKENICAKDNAESMLTWLRNSNYEDKRWRRKIHVIADFSGYEIIHNIYMIKEFSAYSLDITGQIYDELYDVVKPPFKDFEKLLLSYKFTYDYFYDIYGIQWISGTTKYKKFIEILKNYLKYTTFIYIRNSSQKKLLNQLIGDLHCTYICLDKFGYCEPPRMSTECIYHENPDRNNCVHDNSWNMLKWLQKTEMYKSKMRNNYLNRLECVKIDLGIKFESIKL